MADCLPFVIIFQKWRFKISIRGLAVLAEYLWLASDPRIIPGGKPISVRSWTVSLGSRRMKRPEFLENRHTKVARLPALCAGRLYLQDIILVLISVTGLVYPRATIRPRSKSMVNKMAP